MEQIETKVVIFLQKIEINWN